MARTVEVDNPPWSGNGPTVTPTREWTPEPGLKILQAVALGAVGFDIAFQHPIGLATAGAFGLMVGGSFLGGWGTRSPARPLLIAVAGPVMMLMVRESPWLVTLNVVAVLGLLLLAAMVRDEPSPVAAALGRLIRPLRFLEPAVLSMELVWKSLITVVPVPRGISPKMRSILRGVAVGLPIVVVLGVLLASSDALFRSIFEFSVSMPAIGEHVWFLIVGGLVTAGVAGHAYWGGHPDSAAPPEMIGPTELVIALGGIVSVYSVFVVTQVVAITAGAGYVRRNTGLTYAEYARQGFFQLLAAAALTLAVLLLLDRYSDAVSHGQRRVGLLQQATVILTLLVVAVAIRRLFLYESEFGLTMLRFSTIVFAAWIGIVFVLCGLKLANRLGADLTNSVMVSAFLVLMAVNLANPESLVASRNIDRFGGTGQLDIDYLLDSLGPDALPTILPDAETRGLACEFLPRPDDRVLVFNLSRISAASSYDSHC